MYTIICYKYSKDIGGKTIASLVLDLGYKYNLKNIL